jgi:hypothetical protein
MNSEIVDMSDKWAFRVGHECHGMSENEIISLCNDAEILLNISGALLLDHWLHRKEYQKIDVKIFIDTDPAYNQFKYVSNSKNAREIAQHDDHFTFGLNIGEPDCHVPTCGIKWKKTRQPIALDLWKPVFDPNCDTFTTVTSWRPKNIVEYQSVQYGHKNVELRKFVKLPQLTNQKIQLAMSGGVKPKILLDHGWDLVSGIDKEQLDMWSYMRYIQSSRAEWSIAKNIYVATWCGWFSERSACYLAAGKPVLVQDTGFSKSIPTGTGLISFDSMSDILQGIDNINKDYEIHCTAARNIAENYFDSRMILKDMLSQINE